MRERDRLGDPLENHESRGFVLERRGMVGERSRRVRVS
jgi:hypothetical protein